ncbi:helix-turn-helix transcriptional regulator [Virgibacillus halophilus]|uniref:Helix-turn-helix transcriptional regulator n=2 Tax=Tigheibacillus halophilus TaxID=361280 RepID=A0ABU5CBW1_9BACI|nr:helix-turn-helix transcriptional regulator [Virgibacillus halophilus]
MNKIQLKEILVNARKDKNLTQNQVALCTDKDISRQYYGMIENGERRPSVEVAKAISVVLDIPWTIFF